MLKSSAPVHQAAIKSYRPDKAFMPPNLLYLLLITVTFGIMLGGCKPRAQTVSSSITVAGSTSVQPLPEMLAEAYAKRFPDRPTINVARRRLQCRRPGSSDWGGQIGMLSREPAEAEKNSLQYPLPTTHWL